MNSIFYCQRDYKIEFIRGILTESTVYNIAIIRLGLLEIIELCDHFGLADELVYTAN